ncbi:uncharacterized protein LOC126661794 [Mercurialis annua]|uniref:uncharacterized protein LOC126661794 n=1 Tax=Mercurialis annua TaxID=3986 RepID=UPI00215E7755|nr:uncharacterized protein LOC126661794 [Mercurialis annua]
MTPPKPNKPLLFYLSAAHESLGCMLAQEDERVKREVNYLSRGLTDTEIRYTDIEKMCLYPYFTCCKLRYYMLQVVVYVLSQTDIIKYILSMSYLRNQIGKWAIAMSEFTLEETVSCADITTWRMWFDGCRTSQGAGAGVHIVLPMGASYRVSFALNFKCTNNQAEYEALILGLQILAKLGATLIHVWGDSLLVIKQVIGEYKCKFELLVRYCNKAKHLIEGFQDARLEYTERADNFIANDLAQHGSGYKVNLEFDAIERESPNLHNGASLLMKRGVLCINWI